MRFLFALIGYISVATVIAASLGLAYAWQSERINDAKMFELVALLYDIDIDSIAKETEVKQEEELPPEEMSIEEIGKHRQIMMLNHEVRMNALKRSQSEFNFMRSQLVQERKLFDDMAGKIKDGLEKERDEAAEESINGIVQDLVSVKPDKAKDLLLRFLAKPTDSPELKQKGMEDVITLMRAMPVDSLQGILKKFQTPEDLAQLHEIHSLMLKGGPREQVIKNALKQLYDNDINNWLYIQLGFAIWLGRDFKIIHKLNWWTNQSLKQRRLP